MFYGLYVLHDYLATSNVTCVDKKRGKKLCRWKYNLSRHNNFRNLSRTKLAPNYVPEYHKQVNHNYVPIFFFFHIIQVFDRPLHV